MQNKHAVVLGSTGQIGRAAVRTLAKDGWKVTAVSRSGKRDEEWPATVEVAQADRNNVDDLQEVLKYGCDVLVDVVNYGEAQAQQIVEFADKIGSVVVLSTTLVYEDEAGHSFDTVMEPGGFPKLPVPVSEKHKTVQPGNASYITGKVAMEQVFLSQGEKLPTTVLRAGAVYGTYSSFPYELYFIKRNVDGRNQRILEYRGEGRFHRVSVENLAELIRLAANKPGTRVLNACDPEVPTIAEIGEEIDKIMGVETPKAILLDGAAISPSVGKTAWMVDQPMICDMTAAQEELGYQPSPEAHKNFAASVKLIAEQLKEQDWETAFPLLAQANPHIFDYKEEDEWIRANEKSSK